MSMQYEYGILSENVSYSISNSSYEMGWRFKTNSTPFYFYGFRVKAPNAVTKTCRLWDSSNRAIAEATISGTTVAGQWTEFLLSTPLILDPNTVYTISTQTNSNYYYAYVSGNNFTFNPLITFQNGKAGSPNSYPSNYTEQYIYPMIDMIISVNPPYLTKYLFADNDNIYTVQGGNRVIVPQQTLTANVFETYGMDDAPELTNFSDLTNPKIYHWCEKDDVIFSISVDEVATPFPQIVYTDDYDMTDPSILGIEDADVVASSDVLFAISTDQGVTWKAHNGTTWITLSSQNSGMNADTFNAVDITDWAEIYTGNSAIRVRAILPALTSYIESVIINYIN